MSNDIELLLVVTFGFIWGYLVKLTSTYYERKAREEWLDDHIGHTYLGGDKWYSWVDDLDEEEEF